MTLQSSIEATRKEHAIFFSQTLAFFIEWKTIKMSAGVAKNLGQDFTCAHPKLK